VIVAEGVTKRFGDQAIAEGFDLTVQRGDRVAFVGPNGVGKTTLIGLLLGRIAPDAGEVRHGTNLEVAVFDQARAQLDPDATLWESLTGDSEMRVSGRADQVMVRGEPRHVVAYLKDFLFDETQARGPVRALSGGERARLLLAKLMARPSNLLVLDEPTNDLDIETLDLLQDLLGSYDGTVLLVSHDRDFLDRVATATVWMEGQGRTTLYAGGWSDAVAQRGDARIGGAGSGGGAEGAASRASRDGSGEKKEQARAPVPEAAKKAAGLSFTERHRLADLPGVIDRLTAEIGKLEGLLTDAELFSREPVKFRKATEALAERQARLAAAEEEWLELAERAEAS
jgi:ATP-binding cassette subfamily F protein uup